MHARQRVQPALGNGPGAIAETRAAFDVPAGLRVVLPALKLLVGRDVRVAVVEVGDQAQIHLIVFGVVEERAARGATFLQRPAQAVHDQPRLMLRGRNLPDLLDANAVVLRVAARVQRKSGDQLLAQMPAAAFRKQGVAGVEFHAAHVAVFVLARGADAHVAGGDAFDGAVIGVEDFRGGKAGVDLDAQALRLLGQPAAHIAHGNDVVALVVRGPGDGEVGQADSGPGASVEKKLVTGDLGVQRGAPRAPIGK